MITAITMATVALASKWDGMEADVIASRTVPASPEAVFAALSEPAKLMAVYPSDCATWKVPLAGTVPGATGVVTYHAAGMHRKLDVVWKSADASRLVELDHLGGKGFITRFSLAADGDGTKVTLTNYLAAPPGIVAGYYFRKVKPAWEGCHQRTLEALEAVVR